MKFIVSSSVLLKQLTSVSGVVVSNPVIPILENFLFELNDKELKITSSDLQTYLTTTIQVEAQGTSKLAIPAKILIETLRNLPDQPITFTIDEESYNVEITSTNGRYKLAGENAEDFPDTPEIDNNISLSINLDVLKKAISKTLFAASNDELRPSMGGVYLKSNKEKTIFVATDGHRLSKYERTDITSDMPISVLMPKKPLNLVSNLTHNEKEGKVNISFNNSHVLFEMSNTQVIMRLVDETFPEYNNVLPKESPYVLYVNRGDLISSLKRVSIYANKTDNEIRLKMAGSDLQIVTEDLNFSNEASERLTCNYEGDDLEVGFNAKFLIESLNNIDSEEIKGLFGQPQRAVVFVPCEEKENEEYVALVGTVVLKDPVIV